MRRINYESDFDFIWTLRDSGGSDIGFPTYDWEAEFKTFSRGAVVKASCIGGVMTNCYNDNNRIHVVLKGHGLEVGELKSKLKLLIPDDKYPDDERLEVIPDATGIELVREKGETPVLGDIESMIPIFNELKGEPFRYEDFTEAQLADLKKPATDAAQECLTAENKRVQAENARVQAENARVQAENARVQEFANYQPLISAKRNDFVDSADIVLKTTTNGEESTVTALELTEMAKRSLFDDLWIKAVGAWGKIDHTHMENGKSAPYYLNELWLTYEEALAVYRAGSIDSHDAILRYYDQKIRTNLPINCSSFSWGSSIAWNFLLVDSFNNSEIEILNVTPIANTDTSKRLTPQFPAGQFEWIGGVGFNLKKCTKILGTIDIGKFAKKNYSSWTLFGDCPMLEDIKLHLLRGEGVILKGCPKLNAASIKHLINNRNPLSTYQNDTPDIVVHADVYDKIVAGEGEWAGILDLAAEKKVTFSKP